MKPGNVIIREDGVAKLADLGIATASDGTRITRSGTVLGTAAYMAPEQLDGSGAGPPADIYALAAIAFEALSGRKPREGRTPMEIAHKIATEGAPDLRDAWPNAPKEAAQVLQRGMALKPEDRPSTAGELARELSAALEDDPGRTRKTRRLGRAAGAGAAAAGAGAAAAASKPDTNGAARDSAPTPTRTPAPTGPPASPPPAIRSGRSSRRPGAGALALALVFLALAGAAIAGSVLSGGDDGSDSSGADGTPAGDGRAEKPKKQKAKKQKEPKEAARCRARSRRGGARGGHRLVRPGAGRRAQQRGLPAHAAGALRRGDSGAPAGRGLVPARHRRPQLRVRAVQPREVAAAGGPAGRGHPDPRAAARDPESDRRGPGRARPRQAAGRRGLAAATCRSRPSASSTHGE